MALLSASLLSADFGHLEEQCSLVNESDADWFHLDVMDGVFVPNISFGFPVMAAIAQSAKKPLDAHFMTVNPSAYYSRCRDLGIQWVTVHYEACPHLNRDFQQIRQLGMKAGVAINPHTNVSLLADIAPYADLILIMSVNPGFGGQKFIPQSLKKIEKLRTFREKEGLSFLIQVDGGVSQENAGQLIQSGVDVLVAGNAFFRAANLLEAASRLKHPIL